MTILILGSEGFIGSHTTAYFKNRGYSVTCADIVLKQAKDYYIINPEMPDFASLFRTKQFDVCINATGAANVQLSFSYPAMDYLLNTANVYHILEAIRNHNPSCKFINLSSAAVYGNPEYLPIAESHAVKPLSPYGFHKSYAEQICTQFHELYNISTVSLRIFSAYGEGLKKQLFWDLFNKIKASSGIVDMFGTGNESRDFLYIHDITRALDCIIARGLCKGDTINVASGTECTIKQAATILIHALDAKVELNFMGNNKIGDPLNWRADITKLTLTGFTPQYSIEEGIKQTAKWMKSQN